MPLFGKSDSKRATKTIAIVDIGTASVGCAYVKLSKEGSAEVLNHVRVEIPIISSRDGEELKHRTFKSLRKALETLAPHITDLEPSQIAVFLPAPWSSLYLRHVRLTPKKEFRINSGVLERMVQQSLKQGNPLDPSEEIIEHTALGIRLNGYAAHDVPKDLSVQSAELTLVSVSAPHDFAVDLRHEIQRTMGVHHPITLHATSLAVSYALSVLIPETGDYVLCNSEGEVAECLLITEHAPMGASTAPVGCNTIFRTLRMHADMARAEASSALALARNSSSPMATKLKGTLDAAKKECADGFYAASRELLKNSPATPHTIYMLGEGSEGQWFADSVAGSSHLKKLFPGNVHVRTVSIGMIHTHIIENPPQDLFLSLEAIFADARFDEDLPLSFKLR